MRKRPVLFCVVAAGFLAAFVGAQDRLKTYPGYEQFQRMSKEIEAASPEAEFAVKWNTDSRSFQYFKDGKVWKFDLAARKAVEVPGAKPDAKLERGRGRRGGPERGRQFAEALSPDKKMKAFCCDRNLWLSDADGKSEAAVTTEGNDKSRIKYATASWVYGEELDQTTAMWWSPDSKKVAYYRFDESHVPDYFLQLDQTKLYSRPDIEAYPKAGQPNPIADLYIYDLAAKAAIKVDVRGGQPFADDVVGHYVYRVSWTADGRELLFNRTNRLQNILEFVAADPATGKVRVIIREEWPKSWVENSPALEWLKDQKRFIWSSERSGFRNFYLYDLSGRLLTPLTRHPFEVGEIVKVDEAAGCVYYMARDGANPMMPQFHRIGLDGRKDVRLTDPAYHHSVVLSPNSRYFVDVAQTHDIPPFIRLVDVKGKVVSEPPKSDLSKFNSLGLKTAELFKFKAADGETGLFGVLQFPSNFDPAKKYPLLVSVYGGPGWNGARETFLQANPLCEYGFLVASFDFRGSSGRGKRAMDSIYRRLGIVEIDDQAAGVRSLWERPYVNKERVGIYGTSYGGYASLLCLLRHPDVFAAACAQSPVTSWEQYDSIYTERYMGTPEGNKDGYAAANAMTYIKALKGRLMLYYGTADNNVHPTNAMQLIEALQKEEKSIEVQVGPDKGHSAMNQDRMMEFFIENLVLKFVPRS